MLSFGGLNSGGTRQANSERLPFFADLFNIKPINYEWYHQGEAFGVGKDELFGWGSWYESDSIRYVKQGEE